MATGAERGDARAHIAGSEPDLRNERAAHIGYWRICVADDHVTWSPGLFRMFALEPGSQTPHSQWLFDRIEPDDAKALREKIDIAIRTRLPFSHRSRARCIEGTELIVDTHGEAEIDSEGRVVSVVGVTSDVTQHVLAEAERAKARDYYRIIMEAASDIIMLHGKKGRVLFASAALGRILGRTPREFDGKGYLDIVHPDDRAEAEKLAKRPPPGKALTATYRARHRDGHYVWIEATTRSVYDEASGEFRHTVVVTRDVSERKAQELAMLAAREAAETANRAKSAFLANMSHELRTPLNAIIGFTDVMRSEMFGPIANARYREYLSLIHNSGELLLSIISDILDMAKIEAGKFDFNFEQVNLAEIVDECTHLMAERAGHGHVLVSTSMPPQGLVCTVDRRAVKQIILNLLSNAIKFTPPERHVDIAARVHDDLVRIEVRDQGIGIASEDLLRLANPFEQVCTDPNLAKSGTGLGLALVRGLAEKHGGHVEIDSLAGQGTTVTVEFPRSGTGRADAA